MPKYNFLFCKTFLKDIILCNCYVTGCLTTRLYQANPEPGAK